MQAAEANPRSRAFGVFEADLRAAELRKHGIRIKLQEQPFQILTLLLEHPGEVVTREELRQRLWPAHTFVDFDRSLNKAMTKLRAALGDSAENPRYVETIPRHGYRFLASVQVHYHEPVATAVQPSASTHETDPAAANEAPHSGPGPATNRGKRRIRLYGALAAASAALLCMLLYVRIHQPVVLGGSAVQVNPRASVAVLGFTNLSGNQREAWLSTAFSDWLTTELTAGEQVRAIPAESVTRMKMELALPDVDSLGPESLIRIRKNLGTDYVVSGSYAIVGEKTDGDLRLDLRLQDTRSGETITAISESGTSARLLDLVSRAGERLRLRLGVRAVTREEAAEVATALPLKPETAKYYAEGRAKLRAFDALSARDLLQKAVAVEPSFALSHAELATAWSRLGYDENAKEEAKKAFDLSANLSRAERLLTEGLYREMSHDWENAVEINRALYEFFPDNLDYGLALVNSQLQANRWKEALETIDVLRKLPSSSGEDARIDLAEGYASRSLGDSKRADASIGRAAEKSRAAGASLLLARARLDQAWTYENLGRSSEVEDAVREAKQLYTAANDRRGVAEATTIGAIAHRNEGDYLGAKKDYEEGLMLYRQIGYRRGLAGEYDNIADTLICLGDLEGALRSLQAALAIYQETGDQNGEALARNGLGDVYFALGNHSKAKEIYKSALDICLRIGNRGRQAGAVAGLGRVHGLEGDFPRAQEEESEARAIFEEIGDKVAVASVDLDLARLSLDEGREAQAAASARMAAQGFGNAKAMSDEAEANLVLAETLLAEGKVAESRKNLERVLSVARQTHNRKLELSAALAEARVRAASGKAADVSESLTSLDRIIAEATAGKFARVAMEARLALGETQLNFGDQGVGRAILQSLEKESAGGGFATVARKAAAALKAATRASI
jgi:DNA-binding winged helix-turn-helix (wHTH) protein/tetratricopeptide (TPR) repeat protein